jgi:hypothetical protein
MDSSCFLSLVTMVSSAAAVSFTRPRHSLVSTLLRAAVALQRDRSRLTAPARAAADGQGQVWQKVAAELLKGAYTVVGLGMPVGQGRMGLVAAPAAVAFRQAVALPGLPALLQRRLAALQKSGAVAHADEHQGGKDREGVQVALGLAREVERVGRGLGLEPGWRLAAADRQRMMLPQLLGQLEAAAQREGGGAGGPLGLARQQCRQLLGLEPMPAAPVAGQGQPSEAERRAAEDLLVRVATGAVPVVVAFDQPRPVVERRCTRCGAAEGLTAAGAGRPRLQLQLCGGCRAVWYCSRECQRAGWGAHKAACRSAQVASGGAV